MKVLDRRYELHGLIAKHELGGLWLAQDLELARTCLVREITAASVRANPGTQRMLRVCSSLAQLSSTNLERVLSIRKSSANDVYLFYEYSKSITLRQLIDSFNRVQVTADLKAHIIAQAANGLAVVHGARERLTNRSLELFHLGLRPETICLTAAGGVRVVDFGLAYAETERSPTAAAYLAPEQIEGLRADQSSDIYRLGLIGYELLLGQRLFKFDSLSGQMAAILKADYDLSSLREACSSEMFAIISRCLNRDRRNRFQTAVELADKINLTLGSGLRAPGKKIGEYVENLFETPKLVAAEDTRREVVETVEFSPSRAESGLARMTDSSGGSKERKRPRPGEETVIRSVPVSERLKRMQPGRRGGNKLLVTLSIIAGLLLVGLVVVLAVKYLGGPDRPDEVPVTEMETGRIVTVPEGASLYLADSLVGKTPGEFSLKPGETIRIKHECCEELTLPVDFDRFAAGPVYLEAVVEVISDPAGATILLGDEPIDSVTPCTLRLSPEDTLDLTLELSGRPALRLGGVPVTSLSQHQSDAFEISPLPDGGYRLEAAFTEKAKPLPQVLLTSSPSGATVTIAASDQVIGETPLRYRFGKDPIKLIISRSGYEDRVVNLPSSSSRRSRYSFLLFRQVYVTAYEEGDIEKTVNCRIKDVICSETSYEFSETTPAYMQLPGVNCQITLAADGYLDTDTSIAPGQKELAAVMRRQPARREPVSETARGTQEDAGGDWRVDQAEVKIFVTDKKNVPVEGASITAEDKRNDDQVRDLGITDGDGKLIVYLKPSDYKFIAKHVDFKLGDESKEIQVGKSYILTIEIKRR